jgi:DNA-binding beta-propeller fold protein YncE
VTPRARRRRRRLSVLPGALATLALVGAAPAGAATPMGALTQLPGQGGCVSDTGSAGRCADGTALDRAAGVAVSHDGYNVYVAAESSNAVVVLDRDPVTGSVSQLGGQAGCVSDNGSGGACAVGRGLTGASNVAVSPDDRNVYVSGSSDDTVAVFSRDAATGALAQLGGDAGCVSLSDASCRDAIALDEPRGIAPSSDGRFVYVGATQSNAVAAFARGADGSLTQLSGTAACVSSSAAGCTPYAELQGVNGVAASPDGAAVYAAAFTTNAVVALHRDALGGGLQPVGCVRDGGGGGCAAGRGLLGVDGVAVSPDSTSIYTAAEGTKSSADGTVAAFAPDAVAGLVQLAGAAGCVANGAATGCATGRGLENAYRVAVAPDGLSVYVAGFGGPVPQLEPAGVAALARDGSGGLGQLPGQAGCNTGDGSGGDCQTAEALVSGYGVAVDPEGDHVYVSGVDSDSLVGFGRQVPPVCHDAVARVPAGTPVALPLDCFDPNGDAFARRIDVPPANGTLGPIDDAAGTVTYTAAARYGSADVVYFDVLYFAASDGSGLSPRARVDIKVVPRGGPVPPNAEPASRIVGLRKRTSARRLRRFRGTARDDQGVRRVEVSVLRVQRRAARAGARARVTCRTLKRNGHLSRAKRARRGRCTTGAFLRTRGTTRWRLALRRRLPRGSYVAFSRAVDVTGKYETRFSRKRGNRIAFKVR